MLELSAPKRGLKPATTTGSGSASDNSVWKPLKIAAYWLASRAAQSYTAPTVEDARQICLQLGAEGLGTSVAFWNDNFDSVESITHSSLQLIELLRHLDSHSYLSLKLPALQFDSEAVGTILAAAARMSRLIHFDSHGPEHADRMFATIENAFKHNRKLGCTIPGRWLRSIADAEFACRSGLRVRVVKGQWPDPREPEMDMRHGFLRVIDELRGRAVCVAVATHDVFLAREALNRLIKSGTPCELELLYGLPRRTAVDMARQLEVPIRIYVPQGKAWLPYVLKQAKKNPWVLGWFARDLVRGFGFTP
jgi:proline dehydrogenase